MVLRKITFLLSLLFILAACSDESTVENRELEEYFSAYLNDNDKVVGFGNAKIKDILNKAQYEKVMMLKAIIGSQLKTFDGLIDIDGPVYYAANGPFNKDAAPEEIVLFIEVQDNEKLIKHLVSEMGYDVNKADGFDYAADGDMAMGIRNNLVIVLVKSGDYDEKKELTAAFKRVDGKLSSGKIEKMLNEANGDVVVAINLGNIVLNSENGMKGMKASKKKELKKLFAGSFINTTIKFEDGKAIIETKNYFGEKLKSKMFFNSDPSAKVLSNLGGGSPIAGFSMNMDVNKMENLMNDIRPQLLNQIAGMQFVTMKFLAGTNDLGEILNGTAGAVYFKPTQGASESGRVINYYIGLKPKGEKLIASAQSLFGEMIPMDLPDFNIQNKGLSVIANSAQASTNLSIPAMAKGFGKSGINFFINLENLTERELESIVNSSDFGPILEVATFVSFEYTNEGGKLVITAKKGDENILKQSLEAAVSDLSELMGGVSF